MDNAMPLSVRIERFGGPEVMQIVELAAATPGPDEVAVRHTAIGLNFIDTYNRSGLYPVPLPGGLGQEAAGIVTAIGSQIRGFAVGDRVAYAGGPAGSYCSERVMNPARLVKLPAGVSDEAAAALLLKGMTAYYLLHLSFAVKPGHTLLVHAAAGGVGSVLVPWAKHLGARVIGTAGSTDKAALAKRYGCDEVILYREQDVAKEVRRLTN
jgi:NADPH2:quinone reductase